MKSHLLSLVFALILVIPVVAQQSTDGKVGTYIPGGPVPPAATLDGPWGTHQLFVHEYNTNQNLIFKFNDLSDYFRLASITPYINTGDFANDGFLYATGISWDNNLNQIDIRTGNSTLIGTISGVGQYSVGMAYNPTDDIMYLLTLGISGSQIYSVSLSDASTNLLATFPSVDFRTLAFDINTNALYTIDQYTDQLHRISISDWNVTMIGNVGFSLGTYFSGSDFNEKTGELYVSQYDGYDAHIYTVNTSNGTSTLQTTVPNSDFIVLAIHPSIIPVSVSIWVVLSLFALIIAGFVAKRIFF